MSTDPLIGKQFGSYELKELLGRGGMAAVYRGYQASIDRSVAVKVLPGELLHDPNFATRFFNEARMLAKLTHPAILPLYDFGEANGMPYIVMPLMTNGTLADRLKNGPLPLAEVVTLITAMAGALDFANKQGILHRDVKPNNILFDQHNNPYLADFGIAKAMESTTNITGTGIIGTPDYMSPEQARGDTLDHRSDMYSLGVVTYQCLTGAALFRATTPMGLIFKHVSEAPRPLREVRPDVPDAVDQVVLKVLAKQPDDRYPSASDFARALSRAAADALATPPQVGTSIHNEPVTEVQSNLNPGANLPPEPVNAWPGAASSSQSGAPQSGAAQSGAASFGSFTPEPSAPFITPPPPPRQTNWLLIGGGAGLLALLCCGVFGAIALFMNNGSSGLGGNKGTPTAPPVQVLFQDDFSSPSSKWNPSDSRTFSSGAYVFKTAKTKWFVWDNIETSYNNILLTVTAHNQGADDAAFGLICDYQDKDNFYYAGVSADGYYAIIRSEAGKDYFLTDATNNKWLSSDKVPVNAAAYDLTLDCSNGDLKLTVNGVQLAAVQDDKFSGGGTGLFLLTFEKPDGEVHFNNYKITQR